METVEIAGPVEAKPADLSPSKRRRVMRSAIIGQCLGMPLWHCLVTGGLGTMYALSLGAGDLYVGVINGALFLGVGALALVPDLVERRDKRWTMLTFWSVSGLAAAPLIFMPDFLGVMQTRWALGLMALACMIYAGSYAAGAGAWTALFRDVVPPRISPRFLGVLRMAWQLSSLGAFLGVALFVGEKVWPAPERLADRYRLALAALLLGHMLRLPLVARLPRVGGTGPLPREGLLERMIGAVRDPRRRRSLAFCGVCSFLGAMSLPSMLLYMHHGLGYEHRTVLFAGAAGMAGGFVTFPLWGRLVRRHGQMLVSQGGILIHLAALGLWVAGGMARSNGLLGRTPWVAAPVAMALFFCSRAAEAGLSTAFAHEAHRLRPGGTADPAYEALQPAAQWVAGAAGVVTAGVLMRVTRHWAPMLGADPYLGLFFLNAVAFLGPLAWVGRTERGEGS